MEYFGREELKNDFACLIMLIQSIHKVSERVWDELFVFNVPVKGLCHTRMYFIIIDTLYIKYEMDHVIVDVDAKGIGRSLQSVTFYDDFTEYESARVRELGAARDQVGLNLN
jgi:hypothetical protein